MANDSIIARPTNKVRVIVAEASGCCASEVSAVATARPSPSAGHMQPMPVVMPAVAIDTTATTVTLSIRSPFYRGCFLPLLMLRFQILRVGLGLNVRLRICLYVGLDNRRLRCRYAGS